MSRHVSTPPRRSQEGAIDGPGDWVQVTGDHSEAWLETAPSSLEPKGEGFIPVRLEGLVTIDPDTGETSIDAPTLSSHVAAVLAIEFRMALLDERLIDPEQGVRYRISDLYAALDRLTAERLSSVTGLPYEKDPDVELVHSTPSWALWSDGLFTPAIALPLWARAIKTLSDDAEHLITMHRASKGPAGQVTIEEMSKVVKAVQREQDPRVEIGDRMFVPPTLSRLDVELESGETQVWCLYHLGQHGGYGFELFRDRQSLEDTLNLAAPNWLQAA